MSAGTDRLAAGGLCQNWLLGRADAGPINLTSLNSE
jgi:hypothetical protein